MGRRKKSCKEQEDLEEIVKEKRGKGLFFGCYLLSSLSKSHKGQSYIGFTVDPRRRIRQHNGEIGNGAVRTKKKRPWEMAICIYGFPTNVSALQFEWAWQHPRESLAVNKSAADFKSLGGLSNKIKLAFTMLTLAKWKDLDLTVNFFSSKYTKHSAGCPTLPEQMSVQVCSMDDLPCYTGIYNTNNDNYEDEDRDDLDDNDLVDDAGTDDTSTNEGLKNITVKSDQYNYKRVKETFIFGGQYDIAKESMDEMDHQVNEEMIAIRGEYNDEGGEANSPIVCHRVEVIDLLSPSPGYRVGLQKRRKVCSGIIDLTQSPILV